MPRTKITEPVIEQLREVIESGEVEDPVDRYSVQAVAHRNESTELARFIVDADASTYYEAVVEALGEEPEPPGTGS
jgi:hypothetical protein